jgi:ABC-type Fe3+-hydroxamate transport system substrate-binding protein
MAEFVDQLGKIIKIDKPIERIVSIVPSQSEFLWDISLGEKIVGITKFCVHPQDMFKNVTRVGGTKNLNIENIRALKPDIIIGNKEENSQSDIELLQKEFKVWMSDIFTLDDAYDMMQGLGILFNKEKQARGMIKKIQDDLMPLKNIFNGKSIAYFIWKKPYMVAGGNTFINDLLYYFGFDNVFINFDRYPKVTLKQLQEFQPDYCFLSSEPYPFAEKDVQEFIRLIPNTRVIIVDGEVWSWYGSRLLYVKDFIVKLQKIID